MKVLLTTLNAKFIHVNLALRWLYVAADPKHETVLKEFVIKDSLDKICSSIVEIHPDVIGFSTYIWNGEQIKKLVPMIKNQLPECRIILGGPEVSYQYEDYLIDEVDAIQLGEGEITFWQYVNQEENIQGLITHSSKNTVLPRVDIAYLESLPSPYLLDFDRENMGKRYLYVETSRGCPYQCGYCLASLDNHVRFFSLDYLFKLFDELEKRDVKQIKFLDRTFNCDKKRAYQIAQRLLKYKKGTSFQFEVMADTLSDELIDLINQNQDKDKFRFEVGIQSFNQQALQEVRRYQNLEKLVKNIAVLRQYDAVVHADLIAGLPYEDIDSFKDTYHKLFAMSVSEMQVGILKLLKGSRLRKEMDKYDIVCEETTPYQIISNRWVSREDIHLVELVALATERLWNRGLLRETLWHVFETGTEMFDFMAKIGQKIDELPRPYQPQHLFQCVYDLLEDEDSRLMLLNEYYITFRQRPVRFIENQIDKKMRHDIFEVLVQQGAVSQNDIRYAFFDYGYYHGKAYQILLFTNDSKQPQRFFVSLQLEYLE